MKKLILKDIQGFLMRGFGKMQFTRYYLLKIENKEAAKKWIDQVCNDITDGEHSPETTCLNIAFTWHGLNALGMDEKNLRSFSREFREGMDTPHRNRLLGDQGSSDPKNWHWGAKNMDGKLSESNIHIMLLVFAATDPMLQEYCEELEKTFLSMGLVIVKPLNGQSLKDNKIHIGFMDGISQPVIEGSGKVSHPNNIVAAGEFILGHRNEYGVYPDSPYITTQQGDLNLLPLDDGGSGKKDMGNNGSYLVFRQMEERVDLFWKYVNEQTKNADGTLNELASIKLASKMVGRWPSGAPLAKFPDADPGVLTGDEDNFGYQPDDVLGQKCPFGSHMRRSNPRDAFEDNNPKKSIKLTNKHRILRRGRSYGDPIVSTPTDHHPEGDIGLHFMCFNADIANQYEFIMHTWCTFPRFGMLYNDPDPIIGVSDVPEQGRQQNFTVQGEPVNKTYMDIPSIVTIRGGAYFFFPSITTIKYFSTI